MSSSRKRQQQNSDKVPIETTTNSEHLLSSSIHSASWNIVFQVLLRLFSFSLNAVLLRHVTHTLLGICNVRLQLLYSTIIFLSREPFRRSVLRKGQEPWAEVINLIWTSTIVNLVWASLFYYIWTSLLQLPDPELVGDYKWGVYLVSLATVIDSLAEPPYIVSIYHHYTKLKITCDTLPVLLKSSLLLYSAIYKKDEVLSYYGYGAVLGAVLVLLIYHVVVAMEIGKGVLPFSSWRELLPNNKTPLPWHLTTTTTLFFKQSILKQLLTEGERYIMTFLNLLSFEEQGIYDLVSNLGSLAARFVFQPIEESCYSYFARVAKQQVVFETLINLLRLMLYVSLLILAYGVPFSHTLLELYGGLSLANSIATKLLQCNCLYIVFISTNGVLEAYSFAVMGKLDLELFNRKLVLFSLVYLSSCVVLCYLWGPIGFYLGSMLSMSLRIRESVSVVKINYTEFGVGLFRPSGLILLAFVVGFIACNLVISTSLVVRISAGLVVFIINLVTIYLVDKSTIQYFVKIYKAGKSE